MISRIFVCDFKFVFFVWLRSIIYANYHATGNNVPHPR